jgi:hypothetical protein
VALVEDRGARLGSRPEPLFSIPSKSVEEEKLEDGTLETQETIHSDFESLVDMGNGTASGKSGRQLRGGDGRVVEDLREPVEEGNEAEQSRGLKIEGREQAFERLELRLFLAVLVFRNLALSKPRLSCERRLREATKLAKQAERTA